LLDLAVSTQALSVITKVNESNNAASLAK